MRNKVSNSSILLVLAAAFVAVLAACEAKPLEFKAYGTDVDVPRISVEEAKKEFDSGSAIIVDARDVGQYDSERIAGSIHLQNGANDEDLAKLPKGKKIIVYCS